MEKTTQSFRLDREILHKFRIVCDLKNKTQSEYIGELISKEIGRIIMDGFAEILVTSNGKITLEDLYKLKESGNLGEQADDALLMGISKDLKKGK